MIEYVSVLELKALDGHRLWMHFSNGSEGVRDFSDILEAGGEVIEPIRSEAMFRRAFVSRGVPTWPSGLQLDPTNLHMELAAAGLLTSAVAAE
ncbi:MAG: DUF2442 domain-containing protein [Devosia sp.]